MKPKISSISSKNIPLNYVIKYCSNIELISNNYPKLSTYYTKYTYQQAFSQIEHHLHNRATILINSTYQLTDYEYEVIGEILKHQYRFTSLYFHSKYAIKNILDLTTKLNPKISFFTKINLLIKYYLLKIFIFIQNKIYPLEENYQQKYLDYNNYIQLCKLFFLNIKKAFKMRKNSIKTKSIIYNPSNIDVSDIKFQPLKQINRPLKIKKLNKYSKIYFIYEKYNPTNLIYFYQVKNYCLKKQIKLGVIKI